MLQGKDLNLDYSVYLEDMGLLGKNLHMKIWYDIQKQMELLGVEAVTAENIQLPKADFAWLQVGPKVAVGAVYRALEAVEGFCNPLS